MPRRTGGTAPLHGDRGAGLLSRNPPLPYGEKVLSTGKPLSVKLGPGLIGNIFDGIERPLSKINEISEGFIPEGIGLLSLDTEKKWEVKLLVKEGDKLKEGQIFGEVEETSLITHKLIVPPGISGRVVRVKDSGSYSIEETLVELQDEKNNTHELKMYQEWGVRMPRPVQERLPISRPLVTGQRVLDIFFPIAKGGTSAIPGGFGTGKTMTQHQLAKWSDADIIVYIGCGERGNEMTDVLEEFPKLVDPKTNKPIMERTILIANTSNMPVAARKRASIRDYHCRILSGHGYDVAIMADSTSMGRSASGDFSRLEEMPAEEGYPAYLPSRLAEFYERAGCVTTLAGGEASVTIIGAVSPAGGDFSEPVTENTKRYVNAFWALIEISLCETLSCDQLALQL